MPILAGQEGQELSFIFNSFLLSYHLKGDFLAFYTVWFKKIFLGASQNFSVDNGVSGQAVQPKPLASLKLSMAVYGQKLDGRPSR